MLPRHSHIFCAVRRQVDISLAIVYVASDDGITSYLKPKGLKVGVGANQGDPPLGSFYWPASWGGNGRKAYELTGTGGI
jgi:hypothetical protein